MVCVSSMCVWEAKRLFMLKRWLFVHVQRQNAFLMVITLLTHLLDLKVSTFVTVSKLFIPHLYISLKLKKKIIKKYRHVIQSSETTGNMSCVSVQQAWWTLQLMILLMVALAVQCILCALFYFLALLTSWAKIQKWCIQQNACQSSSREVTLNKRKRTLG